MKYLQNTFADVPTPVHGYGYGLTVLYSFNDCGSVCVNNVQNVIGIM